MNEPITICSVVLAGGEGRRMRGQDKGLLEYRGKLLVQRALDKVGSASQQLVISCNRNLAEYQQITKHTDISVVTDGDNTYSGPLAGILAASLICQQDWLFIMPCDMPNVPNDVIQRLRAFVEQQECDIAVCHDGQRRQNLVMLLRLDVTESLAEYLNTGGRRVDSWQNLFRVQEVDFSDKNDLFGNLNAPEDFRGS